MPNELVSLYRCKICGTRMFIERTGRHLEQAHQLAGGVEDHFEAGPRDTFRSPGGLLQGKGHAKPGRGRPVAYEVDEVLDG